MMPRTETSSEAAAVVSLGCSARPELTTAATVALGLTQCERRAGNREAKHPPGVQQSCQKEVDAPFTTVLLVIDLYRGRQTETIFSKKDGEEVRSPRSRAELRKNQSFHGSLSG
jgi:hypothetical protein